jgi:hypothetical protein
MKKLTLALLATAFIEGCATTSGTQSLKTNDMRECAKNFTYDGSFLAGRTYKTHVLIKDVPQKEAMKRAARYTINDGWQITNTDENLGIISASRTVSFGDGKTVPLNIGFETVSTGLKVSMTFSTSGGVTSPLESITKSFCSTIEAIEGK